MEEHCCQANAYGFPCLCNRHPRDDDYGDEKYHEQKEKYFDDRKEIEDV